MNELAREQLFIGVDVGTGSARAGLFDSSGSLLATARHPIHTWYLPGDLVEQSSDDIWQACSRAVTDALALAAIDVTLVAGIGFDATCSLVAVDSHGAPLTVSPDGDPSHNVIVWMDHRATAETAEINATADSVLRYVGGQISPEMETPKLLWLKRHLPETYAKAEFFDLADYLSFRATGSRARSTCTVTCKWTYVAREGGWSRGYFESVGLQALLDDDARRIGSTIVAPGSALGDGLDHRAASDFGLRPGIAVGASLIDAHAGAIATVGGPDETGVPVSPTARVAYILGTSACVMASTHEPVFVPGIWGPYESAIVPGLWLIEGGQSAAGVAIDTLVRTHPCYADARTAAQAAGIDTLGWLELRILERVDSPSAAARLAHALHVLPDYLGNRSPDADPRARAMIAGLTIDHDLDGLQALYVAGLCGIGYGLADIVDALRAEGVSFETIVISGGASHSALVRQILADATGVSVQLSASAEPVLLGAAMLGAVASGARPDIHAAMAAMSGIGIGTAPTPPDVARFHAAKREAYRQMKALGRRLRELMEEAS